MSDGAQTANLPYCQEAKEAMTGYGSNKVAIGYLDNSWTNVNNAFKAFNCAYYVDISRNNLIEYSQPQLELSSPAFMIGYPKSTGAETTIENSKSSILFHYKAFNSKQKIDEENVNRINISLIQSIFSEVIKSDTKFIKIITSRFQDQTITKILSVISNLLPNKYAIEFTSDLSIYFTLIFNTNKLFLEFFLEKSDSEPDFVFIMYNKNDCVANGTGDIDSISTKISNLKIR